jgi:hypothetical protein
MTLDARGDLNFVFSAALSIHLNPDKTRIPSSRQTPVAKHTACCLARPPAAILGSHGVCGLSLIGPSHSQLRETLATTATLGSRSFCGHFSGPSHSRLGRALWARNEGFVPSVLYDGCGVFLVGNVKALGG